MGHPGQGSPEQGVFLPGVVAVEDVIEEEFFHDGRHHQVHFGAGSVDDHLLQAADLAEYTGMDGLHGSLQGARGRLGRVPGKGRPFAQQARRSLHRGATRMSQKREGCVRDWSRSTPSGDVNRG
ncbi:MAG: hypothetical protein BWY56_02565 [Acidobacteria bacterium ADurb.Bin340]|nr:MAG: hypothetical protein BWY56_02565 [Acidobacteria bacterium ADurb.Bin340]